MHVRSSSSVLGCDQVWYVFIECVKLSSDIYVAIRCVKLSASVDSHLQVCDVVESVM